MFATVCQRTSASVNIDLNLVNEGKRNLVADDGEDPVVETSGARALFWRYNSGSRPSL